jgi:large subunit ribosomal protein L21
MKFAIITTGGKQHKVTEGASLRVEKLNAKPSAKVTFDKVMLISDGQSNKLGNPYVKGASVTGTVAGHLKAKKVMVVKFHNKVRYRRTRGHRQNYTTVKIDKITT